MAKSIYEKIAGQLRKEIRQGKFPPGTILPGERGLAERFRVSRPTLRRALEVLIAEESLESRPGIGNIVLQTTGIAGQKKARKVIGFFSVGKSIYYSQLLFAGAAEFAETAGADLRVLTEEMLPQLQPGDLDGVIFANTPSRLVPVAIALQKSGIPVVTINRQLPEEHRISCIKTDAERDVYALIRHALQQGYRKIALIGGILQPREGDAMYQRTRSWCAAYRDAGLPVPEELVLSQEDVMDVAKTSCFLRDTAPEIAFCVTGAVFTATICAGSVAQIRIPEDMQVFCFDDVRPMIGANRISVGYAQMPLAQMGAAAVERVLQKSHKADVQIFATNFIFTDCNSFL